MIRPRRDNRVHVFIGHMPNPANNGDPEPALVLARRRFDATVGRTQGFSYALLLSSAHELCKHGDVVDGVAVQETAERACDVLYGPGDWTPWERTKVGDLLLHHLADLIHGKPPQQMTRVDFENRLARAGAKLRVDGETVLDASS